MFHDQHDLNFSDFILMISLCISLFGFLQLTAAVKLVLLQPRGCKCLSVKPQTHAFSKLLNINNIFCKPLAACHNLDLAANYKRIYGPHWRRHHNNNVLQEEERMKDDFKKLHQGNVDHWKVTFILTII